MTITDLIKSRRNWQSIKLLCGLSAILLILYLGFASQFSHSVGNKVTLSGIATSKDTDHNVFKAIITQPVLTGLDEQSHPYTITADSATQLNADQIQLLHIKGKLQENAEKPMTMQADTGIVNIKSQQIFLKQHVVLHTADDYVITTNTASLYPKESRATSNDAVTVQQDSNHLDAKGGFVLTEHGNNIRFIGPLTMTLHPGNS